MQISWQTTSIALEAIQQVAKQAVGLHLRACTRFLSSGAKLKQASRLNRWSTRERERENSTLQIYEC